MRSSAMTTPAAVAPASRIRRTDSRNRAKRSLNSGHSPVKPVAISLSASPVPTPRNTRPGYRQPIVAKACAITAGL